MTTDRLKNALRARPFQKFILHLADGREIPVMHSEFAIASPRDDIAVVFQPDGEMEIIDVTLITSLEFDSNGKKRSSKRKDAG
jgi:hypothetical protein